jgi:iron complex transport system substrate-binding protein
LSLRFPHPAHGWRAVVFLAVLLSAVGLFSQRVVSLAPGLTEIVFAVGRGDALVGVTRFCDYPAAAKRIEKIGGFLDFNMEALVALAPDIVLAYPEHAGKLRLLPERVRVVTVRHERLSDLLQSIMAIGRELGAENKAARLLQAMKSKLNEVSRRVAGRKKVRILCVAGRSAGELKNMFIIGKSDFLNDLMDVAGGTNAYTGDVAYPSISLETVIFLDPEFILELSAHHEGIPDEKIFALWRPYGMVAAVAKKQVRIIKDSFWLRPGPRVVLIAERLAGMLHRQWAAHD